MATAAQSFTIQLNSASSEKLHKEHYVRTLEPAIDVNPIWDLGYGISHIANDKSNPKSAAETPPI